MRRDRIRMEYGRRIMEGGRALRDLFYEGERREVNRDVISEISARYDLSDSQRERLGYCGERLARAQGIVKYLGEKYGVGEDGNVLDSDGLFREIYGRRYIPKGIKASVHGFGIGFERQKWNYRNADGKASVGANGMDDLMCSVEDNIIRIEKGRRSNIASLCFTMPNINYFRKYSEKEREKLFSREKMLNAIFGVSVDDRAREIYEQVKGHEIRHIADKVLGIGRYGYVEGQSYLFGEGRFKGVEMDFDRKRNFLNRKRESREKRMERLIELDAPKVIVGNEKKYLREIKLGENRIKESYELMKDIVKCLPKKDYEAMSYVLSFLPLAYGWNSVSHLRALAMHLEGRKGEIIISFNLEK